MQSTRVGIREFRENLASYLESQTPVAITRHGATIGIYVPTHRKPSEDDLEALRAAGEKSYPNLRKCAATAESPRVEILVLDANILIRAALGSRALSLLATYSGQTDFFAPDIAFAEAHEHLPVILEKKGVS
jgi:hypothetical protein